MDSWTALNAAQAEQLRANYIAQLTPWVDTRLPDVSRGNAIIPPCALNGPAVTIRKFPARRFTAEDLKGKRK